MPTLLILLNENQLNPDQVETIRKLAPKHDIWLTDDPFGEDPDRVAEVEISGGFTPPPALILNGALKWHHAYTAGMDWMFAIEGHENLPMILTNSCGIHGVSISEHTFAMILAFERHFVKFILNQHKKFWGKRDERGGNIGTIAGKTMLVLGVGAIGQRIAKLAKAHDMQVLGIRRQPELTYEHVDVMYGQHQLHEILPMADYIVSVLPNTPDTQHILGKAEFELMKTGVFVANLGRGVHIDENALIDALDSGKVRGSGLDTFETEPLPKSSPLWDFENVIISPHCAGFQSDYKFEATGVFIENLKRFETNEPMVNVVDKSLGYSLTH
tara:strand:+ start:596 stop:1579 length:984 start_codon:yes stop_codon:yes gene_type:complete